MKVSIITPTYNSEKYIEDCIKSVILQDYQNIEYIIVDGNSTDGSLNIINKYKSKIQIIISEPDSGIYEAINKGILNATGDIIGILNSDDYFISSNVISTIVKKFAQTNTSIILANINYVNNDGVIKRKYSIKYFKPWMFRFGFQPAHPAFYSYKTNYLKYGLYNTNYKISSDFDLMLNFILLNKIKYSYLDETIINMRLGGISNKNFKNKIVLNNEILHSLNKNKIFSNIFFIYSKYLFKWVSFIFK